MPDTEKNYPVHAVDLGRLDFAVFVNEGIGGTDHYSGRLSLSFRNKEGDWESRHLNLGVSDWVLAEKALSLATGWAHANPLPKDGDS